VATGVVVVGVHLGLFLRALHKLSQLINLIAVC
jgi:hypothetical protein